MAITAIDAQLEIDSDRGVIYVHTKKTPQFGVTVLRMCGLPTPIPLDKMLDITVKDDAISADKYRKLAKEAYDYYTVKTLEECNQEALRDTIVSLTTAINELTKSSTSVMFSWDAKLPHHKNKTVKAGLVTRKRSGPIGNMGA